jgi:hypothetical protein
VPLVGQRTMTQLGCLLACTIMACLPVKCRDIVSRTRSTIAQHGPVRDQNPINARNRTESWLPAPTQAVGADESSAGLERLPAIRSVATSTWALAICRGSPLRLAAARCRRMYRARPRDVRARDAWAISAGTRSGCSLLMCMSFNSCHYVGPARDPDACRDQCE